MNKNSSLCLVALNKISITSLLENLCAINLRRKYGEEVYYSKTAEEVDFYIPEQGLGIQVAYSLRDSSVVEREVKGVKTLNEIYPLNKMQIIIRDVSRTIELSADNLIEVLPVWQWLLED